MLKYLPNALTVTRILLIPLILFFIMQDNYIGAFAILAVSAVTDISDGFIARKLNVVSDLGKVLDPLADKLNQISLLVAIVVKEIIPIWILVIFAVKEVIMVCVASFLYGKDVVVSSKWYGKVSTVVLYSAIFLSMIIKIFDLSDTFVTINYALFYIAIACTLFSFFMYGKAYMKRGLIKRNVGQIEEAKKE